MPGRRLWEAKTSGTTGAVISVSWDRGVVVMTNACLWRSRRWAGVEFGRPYATLFGRLVVPVAATRPPFWRVNRSWNQLVLSPLHLSDATAPLYLDAMRDFGAEALEAYPSSAYVLARYAEAAGVHLPLKAVFTTSEPLLPVQREVIEERFRCPVFDFYSQAERVMFSSECEAHEGHHVFEEYGVTELVDDCGRAGPRRVRGPRRRDEPSQLRHAAHPLRARRRHLDGRAALPVRAHARARRGRRDEGGGRRGRARRAAAAAVAPGAHLQGRARPS